MSDSKKMSGAAIGWWITSALVTLALLGGLGAGYADDGLGDIQLHRLLTSVLAGILLIAANVVGVVVAGWDFDERRVVTGRRATGRAFNYEDGFGAYMASKLRTMFLAFLPLVAVFFLYLGGFVAAEVVHPMTLLFMGIMLPLGVIQGGAQGIMSRFLVPSTGVGIALVIFLVLFEAALPLVCCLPTVSPVSVWFMVEPAGELGSQWGQGTQPGAYRNAMLMGVVFSSGSQIVFGGICIAITAWRFGKLQGATLEAKDREGKVPCRHCGERIEPESERCAVCGEDAPFGD